MNKTLIAAVLALAFAGDALAQAPILTMRPSRWYINNSKVPLQLFHEGIDYDDSDPTDFQPGGASTPVLDGQTVRRPGLCNQPWTGAYGVNKAAFTGSISGTTLTVTSVAAGTIVPGNPGHVIDPSQLGAGSSQVGVRIISQLTGTAGGVGTYQLDASFTVGSIDWQSHTNACQRNAGNFRTICEFVKFDYADPIVFPNGPGKSHLHAFFGNTAVNAFSTNTPGDPKSINDHGNSACSGGTLNRSSYWVPALIYHCPTTFVDAGCDYAIDGTPLKPHALNIYYKGAHGNGSFPNDGTNDNAWTAQNDISAMPQGFRMIAGNPAASEDQETPSGLQPILYECRNANQDSDWITFGHIPGTGSNATDACPALSGTGTPYVKMRTSISFPTCWDGVNLDSPTHNSHVAYTTPGDGVPCPTGWDTQIVGISFQLDYYFTMQGHDAVGGQGKADMKYWRLSSDNYADTLPAGRSGHADWFHGWKQPIMDKWVVDCLRPGLDCHDDVIGVDPSNTTTPATKWMLQQVPRRDR